MSSSAQQLTRRELIAKATAVTTATLIPPTLLLATPETKEPEVTATEDLMREHGVLRRALLVYSESIPKIRGNAASLDAERALPYGNFVSRPRRELPREDAGRRTHLSRSAEGHGRSPKLVDILLAQHARGREITSYLLAVTKNGRIATANAEPLARSLEAFVLMYRNHAAREDTVVFPAWKTHFTNKQLDELSDQFEDIEHKMFGKDGFDDAVEKISAIETTLGFADLSQFTAPPPPAIKS